MNKLKYMFLLIVMLTFSPINNALAANGQSVFATSSDPVMMAGWWDNLAKDWGDKWDTWKNKDRKIACPEGYTGYEPNCTPIVQEPVACPDGFTGFEPNCTPIEPEPVACPEGYTGFEPNCTPVVQEPVACGEGFTGFEPNCTPIEPEPVACPTGYTGFEPNCTPIVQEPVACPEGFTGFEPNCTPIVQEPVPCPEGYVGYEPDCNPNPMGFTPYVDRSLDMVTKYGSGTLDIKETTQTTGTNSGGGQFRLSCFAAKMDNIDPIVNPGTKSMHHHTLFGNVDINKDSTNESITNYGNSTCFGGIANRSAYWIPSLIDTTNNRALEPTSMLIYYKTGNPSLVEAPHPGLRIIAGKATGDPDHPQGSVNWGPEVVRWVCNDQYINNNQPKIMECSGKLTLMIQFPMWWDGVNLDSIDHARHMSYTKTTTHTRLIPDITMNVHYNVNGTSKLRLSSDNYSTEFPGGYSAHADWMNGWDPAVMDTFVRRCLKAGIDCHANLLGNGQALYDVNGQWEQNSVRVPLRP